MAARLLKLLVLSALLVLLTRNGGFVGRSACANAGSGAAFAHGAQHVGISQRSPSCRVLARSSKHGGMAPMGAPPPGERPPSHARRLMIIGLSPGIFLPAHAAKANSLSLAVQSAGVKASLGLDLAALQKLAPVMKSMSPTLVALYQCGDQAYRIHRLFDALALTESTKNTVDSSLRTSVTSKYRAVQSDVGDSVKRVCKDLKYLIEEQNKLKQAAPWRASTYVEKVEAKLSKWIDMFQSNVNTYGELIAEVDQASNLLGIAKNRLENDRFLAQGTCAAGIATVSVFPPFGTAVAAGCGMVGVGSLASLGQGWSMESLDGKLKAFSDTLDTDSKRLRSIKVSLEAEQENQLDGWKAEADQMYLFDLIKEDTSLASLYDEIKTSGLEDVFKAEGQQVKGASGTP